MCGGPINSLKDGGRYRGVILYAKDQGLYYMSPWAQVSRPLVISLKQDAEEMQTLSAFRHTLEKSIGERPIAIIREVNLPGKPIKALIKRFKSRYNLPGITPEQIAA
jgi:hypothetical protein